MKATLSFVALTLGLGGVAQTQTVSGLSTPGNAFIGTYAIAALPPCNTDIQGKFAFSPDVGGGAGLVACNGMAWSRIGLGRPSVVTAASGTVSLKRLESAPIQVINSNPLGALSIVIDATDLQDGDAFYFRKNGLLTGTIGLSLSNSSSTLPIVGNSSIFVVYSADCGCLRQIQ